MRPKPMTKAGRFLLYVLLLAGAVVMLTPLLWLIASTTKTEDDLFSYYFFAPRFSVESYKKLFEGIPFFRYLMNSVFIASATVMVQLFFSSLAGFALAKYEFLGKKPLMLFMLATMLLPGQLTMAPAYVLAYKLHLIDTYTGLILPGAVNVFGIFLFRQAIMQIPTELMQAARMDGCSEFRIYWDIVMPVTRPMIGAFALLSFMGSWNNFVGPQIMLNTSTMYTLPIAINQFRDVYANNYGALMAGTLLAVLPVILLFMALQKEFVAGLTTGAVKG